MRGWDNAVDYARYSSSRSRSSAGPIISKAPRQPWHSSIRPLTSQAHDCGGLPVVPLLSAHAGVLPLRGGFRFFFVFDRSLGADGAVGARTQINVDIVNIAHNVFVIAERGRRKNPERYF